MKKSTNFDDYVAEKLNNPEYAAVYLEVALEEYEKDHNLEALMLILRDLAKVKAGVTKLAEDTGLNRESLYKTLSGKRIPKFDTLQKIIHALGFRLSITPLEAKAGS